MAAKKKNQETAAAPEEKAPEERTGADADKIAADRAAADAAAADENAGGDDPNATKPPAEVVDDAKNKKVELKDKETGFYDRATGFQVVRDQQVALGETVGDATREALQSGRLLIVGGERKKK